MTALGIRSADSCLPRTAEPDNYEFERTAQSLQERRRQLETTVASASSLPCRRSTQRLSELDEASMGLTMEFRAGDARRLAQSFCEHNFAELERMSRASADFSLHLSPNDLELLFGEIMESVGRAPISFTELTGEPIAGDRAEAGVFIVAPTFVRAVAALSEADINGVVERWFCRMGEKAGDPHTNATAEAVIAVVDLLNLCRAAISQPLQVVYCWSL